MKVKLYLFAAAVMLTAVFSGCKDDPIPPTVVTKPASGIAEGTATLNAEITNQGSDAVTSCGFYYNTSADMSYPEVVDANLDGSRFSSVISSLEPGKTYYYMAYAKSSAGMAEGEVLQFVTQAVKPTVETRPVSDVTTSGATLNAAIPSDGGAEITACGFYYSTSENMSNKQTAEFTGTPDSLFSVAISGLQSFTTYYYKAYATNAIGTNYGEVKQFTTSSYPQGAIGGVFSTSSTKQVYFSQGNLQYRASTQTWQFAANQYDIIGSANQNISSSYSGWIDLFGWGTGSNPTNSSNSPSSYTTFTDWGNNAISNGGNQGGLWRTLTKDEWSYLLSGRPNAASLVGKATVNGVTGLVFLPDNWTLPSGCSFTSGTSNAFTANTYTTSQWSAMESAGAVFLPAAGGRNGTSVGNVGSYGLYWSSTAVDSDYAWLLYFSGSSAVVSSIYNRYFGRSVRLVRVVQN